MKENPAAATGTVCHSEVFPFPAVKKRAVQASFTGGEVTRDGGIPLLRQTDRRLGLTKALAQPLIEQSEQAFRQTREQQRRLGEVHYAADTWDKERRTKLLLSRACPDQKIFAQVFRVLGNG
mgnify:FL=1